MTDLTATEAAKAKAIDVEALRKANAAYHAARYDYEIKDMAARNARIARNLARAIVTRKLAAVASWDEL